MTAHQTIAAALGLSLEELADNSYTATPAELERIAAACAVLNRPAPAPCHDLIPYFGYSQQSARKLRRSQCRDCGGDINKPLVVQP